MTPVVLTPPPGLTAQRLTALESTFSTGTTRLSEITAQNHLRAEVARLWPEGAAFGAEIRTHLHGPPGAVLVRSLPCWDSEKHRDAVYLSLALLIGFPVAHQRRNFLFDIAPGKEKRIFPTYSETNDDVPLHTDGAYKSVPPRTISLLVLKQAEVGGEILLADGQEACLRWRDTPEGSRILGLLQHVHTYRIPDIYRTHEAWNSVIQDRALKFHPFQLRFRPDVMLSGLARIGQLDTFPLPRAVRVFSDHLETVPMQVLSLEAGSLLFLNNHRILHGRKAFQGERLLRRIWMM